jgi:uncharacterized protein (TIGR04255 family)
VPFHEAHSIELAAASVNFSEPMTDVVWRRVVRDAEAMCKAAGLTERNVTSGIQITINPAGMPPQPTQIDAIVFVRPSTIELPGGGLQKTVAESLSIGRTSLTVQTYDYTRWHPFFGRLQLLLTPPLRSALHAVSTANLRLEYRDHFRFEGTGAPIAAELLRVGSELIAPHVFNNEKLWHSHTGFFEDAEGCDARLIQINVDANDASRIGDAAPFRLIAITTAVQNNLTISAEPLENEEETAKLQLTMFNSMHDRSKAIFRELISDVTAERVGIT